MDMTIWHNYQVKTSAMKIVPILYELFFSNIYIIL